MQANSLEALNLTAGRPRRNAADFDEKRPAVVDSVEKLGAKIDSGGGVGGAPFAFPPCASEIDEYLYMAWREERHCFDHQFEKTRVYLNEQVRFEPGKNYTVFAGAVIQRVV